MHIAGVRGKISVKMCIPAKFKHLYSSDGKAQVPYSWPSRQQQQQQQSSTGKSSKQQ